MRMLRTSKIMSPALLLFPHKSRGPEGPSFWRYSKKQTLNNANLCPVREKPSPQESAGIRTNLYHHQENHNE